MKDYNIELEVPESGLEAFCLEFAQDRIDELARLKDSLNSGDFTQLHELTHKWIGFSEPYGFHWLAKASRELKEQVKAEKIAESQKIVKSIESYLIEKKDYLNVK